MLLLSEISPRRSPRFGEGFGGGVGLPIFPELTEDQQRVIVNRIKAFYNKQPGEQEMKTMPLEDRLIQKILNRKALVELSVWDMWDSLSS